MFKVVHKNSIGSVINEDDTDIGCEPFADETDTSDMIIRYVRASEVYPGDTISVVEV